MTSLILSLCLAFAAPAAAGTVVGSTVAYSHSNIKDMASVALPDAGLYAFDLVVIGTPTDSYSAALLDGLTVYLQAEGADGRSFYTVPNSTFTVCDDVPCSRFIYPGVYLGGNIRVQWAVVSGSSTLRVTARKVTP